MEKGVDTDLYSRQIGTFGMETMGKLIHLKVLIVGMRGLGAEVAKNIILSGPESVTLYDPVITNINDLGSNFYLSQEDVGKKNRDEASKEKLSELNPYVKVSLLRFESTNNFLMEFSKKVLDFNVVVFTEIQPSFFLTEINNVCHKNNIKFIYACCLGLAGYVFTDFGSNHTIFAERGNPLTYNIKSITKDKKGLITIDNEKGENNFSVGDGGIVSFSEIEGMTELNGKEFPIEFENYESFRILQDTSNFHDYIKGGKVTKVKSDINKQYFDYKIRSSIITDPMHPFLTLDAEKKGRAELLYMTLIGIHDFFITHNGLLPELNNLSQAKEIEKNVKQFYDTMTKDKKQWFQYQEIQEYDEKVVLNVIRWSRAEICPITGFFGGIIAHEIIKATGKYEPIDQWLIIDFLEVAENISENADRRLKGLRYDDQVAIFGNEIQEKIQKSKIFMVGAGATGCEFLKNFAMMGFCTATKESKFIVTDNDSIEISNLSRQFLFRKKDVGTSKAETACKSVKLMNPSFNAIGLQKKVCEETEDYFDEEFWNNQDFIIMAVDSTQARKYIDTRVIKFERCSMDAGTLGTKANSQCIVPFKTMTYGDNPSDDDEKPKVIPMCTLRHFPSQISHCIEWSRDVFNDYFISTVNDIKNYFTNFQEFEENIKKEGSATQNLEKLNEEKIIIDFVINNDIDKVIEFAVRKYTDNFDWRIRQLLYNFPPDYKNEEGKPFWSGSKKLPHYLPYDSNDDLCFLFVKRYITIIVHALGLNVKKEQLSDDYIRKKSSKIKIPKFEPKTVKIDISENNNNNENTNQKGEIIESDLEKDEKKCEEIFKELSKIKRDNIDGSKIKPEEFEKDHDDNGHIDFIHASSNLRARNYDITECDRPTTKMTAGKIIPTILTTTATVAGHVSLQLYTLLQTHDIKYLRNVYFDLSNNYYLFSEPSAPKEIKDKLPNEEGGPMKAIPEGFNIWDKIEIRGSKTCKELFDYLKGKYNIVIDFLIANGQIIISTLDEKEYDKRIGRKIEELFFENSKIKLKENVNYLTLQVVATVKKTKIGDQELEDVSVDMPKIKYIFK